MTVNVVPYVVQALSHPADNFRRALSFVGQGNQGVRTWATGDLQVSQNGTPNMSVNVSAGQALIAGTQNTTSQGSYHLLNDAVVNLTIAASDPTNPRIDIVCASVQDAAYSGSNNQALVQVITGTPAPSPSPPATPANSIVLAQVAVAANATSITSGNITDKRPFFATLFKASMYLSASQSSATGSNTTTQVAYDTILYDPNGNLTTGASAKYTAPVGGYYWGAANTEIGVNNSPQRCFLSFFVNGTERKRGGENEVNSGGAAAGYLWGFPVSALVKLNAADTLDARLFNIGANAVSLTGGQAVTYFDVAYHSS